MSEWQPIESAEPATPVLTWGPDGMKVGFYYDGSWLEKGGDDLWMIEPTHWMPLPEPPKEVE